MSDRQGIRVAAAALGLILGFLFIAGVIRSIMTGEAEWWSAIIVLPILFIMYRLYARWIRSAGQSR